MKIPSKPANRYPALRLWWRELVARKRTKTTTDPLWQAAVEEYRAMEWDADGLPEIAPKCRREAREIIDRASLVGTAEAGRHANEERGDGGGDTSIRDAAE